MINEFLEAAKRATKSGPIFNEEGKCIGFIDFKKDFDAPKKEPETLKEKLKRISKPNLINND